MRRAAWGSVFLLRSAFLNPRLAFTAGILIFATLRYFLFMFRSKRNAALCYFLDQKKVTKD